MKACIDIDGVLFPWDLTAREALQKRFGEGDGESTCWHGLRDTVSRPAWRWLWSAEGQDVVFGQVERCYEGAVLAVRALLALGHDVHFVTHRDPQRTLVHTAAFLDLHFGDGPRWAGVHSVKSRTPKRTLGRWALMVEDKPETVLEVVRQETTMVFAPRRPWNQNDLEDGPHLRVYTNPWDFVRWAEVAGVGWGE